MKSLSPIAISVIGVIIALLGVYQQSHGGGSLLVWFGLAITLGGLSAAKKPKT